MQAVFSSFPMHEKEPFLLFAAFNAAFPAGPGPDADSRTLTGAMSLQLSLAEAAAQFAPRGLYLNTASSGGMRFEVPA